MAVARYHRHGELTYFLPHHYGGGAFLFNGAAGGVAVATGVRRHLRLTARSAALRQPVRPGGCRGRDWSHFVGHRQRLLLPARALHPGGVRRHGRAASMLRCGATSEDFSGSPSSTACAANSEGLLRQTDHVGASGVALHIAEPLHLLDCCQGDRRWCRARRSSAERAKDLPPAGPSSRARHRATVTTNTSRPATTATSWRACQMASSAASCGSSRDCRRRTWTRPSSTTTSTPHTPMQLEELGFCGRGEARTSSASPALLKLADGSRSTPTAGQLGEAYIHGMNGIAEASASCAAPRSTRCPTLPRSSSRLVPASPPAASSSPPRPAHKPPGPDARAPRSHHAVQPRRRFRDGRRRGPRPGLPSYQGNQTTLCGHGRAVQPGRAPLRVRRESAPTTRSRCSSRTARARGEPACHHQAARGPGQRELPLHRRRAGYIFDNSDSAANRRRVA